MTLSFLSAKFFSNLDKRQVTAMPQNRSSSVQKTYRHFNDTAICLDLLERGISFMKAKNLTRYRDIFNAVRSRVYVESILPTTSLTNGMVSQISPVSSRDIYESTGDISLGDMLQMSDGIEAYVSQVNEFLDVENFGMDEAMNAWYDALMEEMNTMRPEPSF